MVVLETSRAVRSMFQRAQLHLLPSLPQNQTSIQCLPDLVHFNAIHNPHHKFCVQAEQTWSGPDAFLEITFLELALAVQKTCDWILDNVKGAHRATTDESGRIVKSKPIALYMESDVGLFVHIVALLTLNIPCLICSIRLSPAALHHLLHETGAACIITSNRTTNSAKSALAQYSDDKISLVSSLQYQNIFNQIDQGNLEVFSECSSMVREDDTNVLILHSSGTTGLPKPIRLAHLYLLGYAACHLFPGDEDESKRGLNLSTLPLYHGFGALGPCLSLSVGKPVCFPPPTTIPSGPLVISMLHNEGISSLMTVPTIMEEITLLPDFNDAVVHLKALEFVAVGGGGLKPAVAELLHQRGVRILNHFGATELGALAPIFRPDSSYDYRYLRVRSDMGLALEPLGSRGDSNLQRRLSGTPFGWKSSFELQDILECNPQNSQEVKILGRKDDMIVLATGEKVLPHIMEQTLEKSPSVRRAVVFGEGQFEVGVIVEPVDAEVNPVALVDELWPLIIEANALMDGHAQILAKDAVLVKPPEKKIVLTDKGSVQRRRVYADFRAEISEVYERLAQKGQNGLALDLSKEQINLSVRQLVQSCLPPHCAKGTWDDDDDLIQLGMDSLRATRLRRTLEASLPGEEQLPPDFVYSNPSVNRLVTALSGDICATDDDKYAATMQSLVSKYAIPGNEQAVSDDASATVLLTGTTGSLGAHMLAVLGACENVKHIFCLVRSYPDESNEEMLQKQKKALDSRRIHYQSRLWSKTTVLSWSPGKDQLGLRGADYNSLVQCVTHIFHGAWPMDFKMKLASFEPHIKAVHDLLCLGQKIHATRPWVRSRVMLASSISVAANYQSNTPRAIVPEVTLDDPSTSLPMGYAQAKWVCEQMMKSALESSRRALVPSVVRIGQLSGSEISGNWSVQEHFPVLVKASQAVGAMPDLKGSLSWIPVDRAAAAISELLLAAVDLNSSSFIYHIENPIRQPWPDVCTVVERELGITALARLPFDEWLDRAMAIPNAPLNLRSFFKDYFRRLSGGGLVLSTYNSRKNSRTLWGSDAVTVRTIHTYVQYWRQIGFLD